MSLLKPLLKPSSHTRGSSTLSSSTRNPLTLSALLVILSLISSAAWAQVTLTINSPTPNACVPNSPPIQPGGGPGEEPDFTPSDFVFDFTFSEVNGDDVTLSAQINGIDVELNNDLIFPEGPGVPTTINYISVLADEIEDGEGLVFSLRATSPAGEATAEVTFDLDRNPPRIHFTQEQVELLAGCDPNALNVIEGITPTLTDEFDNAPTLTTETTQDSCNITRIFTATDHCGEGNSQEIFFQMRTPSAEPADIYLSGIEDGEFYLETYGYFGTTDDNCFDSSAVISANGEEPVDLLNGGYLNTPGSYSVTVSAQDCAGTLYTESADFEILDDPYADAGGPYNADQSEQIVLDGGASFSPPELGGIIEYAWDFDLLDPGDGGYRYIGEQVDFVQSNGEPFDDGVYTVGLRVTTAAGQVRYDSVEVIVSDAPPNCDPGGPYEVEQGRFLTLDGSGSDAGIESEPILAYRWDFGEYDDESDQQFAPFLTAPEYFYSDEGVYTITLTAYDIDSECTAQTTVTVRDVSPEVRDLSVVGEGPYREGQELSFSAGTTTAGSGAEPIIRFSWDWGDGSTTDSALGQSLRNPLHTFADQGSYEVCLTVEDEDSGDTGCLSIEVEDLRPVARFGGDQFAVEGEEARFTIVGTRAGGDADPLSYAIVEWGDGTTTRIDDFSEVDITHVFERDGDFTIRLLVFDEEEADPSIAEFEIYVDDVSPEARISQRTAIIEEGLESVWSAEDSVPGAPSDPIVGYTWRFGDGATASGAEVTHTYADDGSYLLELTVEDSDGSLRTVSRFVTVNNRAPFNGRIIADSAQVDFGEPARFEVDFEDVPNDTVSIFWRMGSNNVTYSGRRVVNHAYTELGIFTIRVLLTDDDGGETELSLDVEVTPAGPRVLLPEIDTIAEGERLSFNVELRAAEVAEGGVDGPVELRVLRAPPGMTWTSIESANPQLNNLFEFEWQTSAGDSGEHTLRILGVSPTGIERIAERTIRVTEARDLQLVTLGGSADRATFSLFTYPSDVRTRQVSLERAQTVEVGRGIGHLTRARGDFYVSAPRSGHVAVIDGESGALKRRVPIGDEPYALASVGDYVWGFDGRRGQVFAIDRRLKVYRRSILDNVEGRVTAARGLETVAGPRIAALTSRGELLLLDPSAFISNQPQRAVTHRLDVASTLGAPLGQAESMSLKNSGLGFIMSDRAESAGDSTQLIAYTARGAVEVSITEDELSPRWALKSAASISSLIAHRGQLWSVSRQGMRRFAWPAEGEGLDPDAPQIEGVILDLNQQSVIASVPGPLMGESTVVTANTRQITHLSADSLRPVLSAIGVNVKRLMITEINTSDE